MGPPKEDGVIMPTSSAQGVHASPGSSPGALKLVLHCWRGRRCHNVWVVRAGVLVGLVALRSKSSCLVSTSLASETPRNRVWQRVAASHWRRVGCAQASLGLRTSKTLVGCGAHAARVGSVVVGCVVAAQALGPRARRGSGGGAPRSKLARHAAAGGAPEDEEATMDEAERMFREAYEAEFERCQLLRQQLENALTERLQSTGGGSGVKISVEALPPMSPKDVGGKLTWREAFEAAKLKTESLEEQLQKARVASEPAKVAPKAPAPASEEAKPPKAPQPPASSTGGSDTDFNVGPFQFVDADKRDPAAFQKLEELATNTIEDEAALRLIAVPILGQKSPEQATPNLPPMQHIRELVQGTEQLTIRESVEFDRVYVLKCSLASGARASDAFAKLQQRFAEDAQTKGRGIELFLQKSKEKEQSVIFVMLEGDLPKNEFAWWQWLLCGLLLVATLVSVNATTFSVATLNPQQLSSMDVDQFAKLVGKTIPTAIAIFSTVASQEVARRAVAARYGVELTPPFFIPVWPIPSVGCFGAITRRLSVVPTEESAVALSAAAGLAGYVVSLSILFYGLSLGPDPDQIVNLNFQLLPLVLKVFLKPFLGQTSLSDQPDPFLDPVSLAFPANPITIGGIVGLIVTSLNLLPIGRLDGGIIIKSVLGGQTGNLVGFGAWFLLLLGAAAPGDAAFLFITFGFFVLFFQNGSENPARDAVTESDGSLKVLGLVLVFLGALLSIPGAVLPNI